MYLCIRPGRKLKYENSLNGHDKYKTIKASINSHGLSSVNNKYLIWKSNNHRSIELWIFSVSEVKFHFEVVISIQFYTLCSRDDWKVDRIHRACDRSK